MSSTALSPLDQLAQSGQTQPLQQTQPASDLSPLDQLAQSSPTQTAPPSGEITNDVGNTVIVPKDGESFGDTMQRAAAYGKTVTPQQINAELATAPKKAATVLAAAPVIGAGGTAALAVPGEVADFALKHLAGNVLPGMEYEAAKQTLIQAVPTITQFIQTMSKLGIGAGGLTYAIKTLMGDGKK